jgi:ribulose-phosphate 3-epimerase
MTVNPGFGGQRFIRSVVPKIARLSAMARAASLSLEIEVDGGISPETAPEAVRAGATHLVAGQAVYGTGDVEAAMRALREAVSGG